MQLTTVGRDAWRGAKRAQALIEAGADDPTVQDRLQRLKQVEAIRKLGASWPEIQALVEISRATYYRWRQSLKNQGLKGLLPKPKRPKHFRGKVHWTPELFIAIETLKMRPLADLADLAETR